MSCGNLSIDITCLQIFLCICIHIYNIYIYIYQYKDFCSSSQVPKELAQLAQLARLAQLVQIRGHCALEMAARAFVAPVPLWRSKMLFEAALVPPVPVSTVRSKNLFEPASVWHPPVRSKRLFESAVQDHYSRVQDSVHCALRLFAQLSLLRAWICTGPH